MWESVIQKIADGKPLAGHEKQEFIARMRVAGEPPRIISPLELIYSNILEVDTTSVSVNIPGIYSHLMIMGMGRTTESTGGNVWVQFNEDQASNYKWVSVVANPDSSSSAGAFQDTSDIFAALGLFANSGAGDGIACGFQAWVPHYATSRFHKTVISHTNEAKNNDYFGIASTWANTAPITSLRISATDNTLGQDSADMLADSIISVYGVR